MKGGNEGISEGDSPDAKGQGLGGEMMPEALVAEVDWRIRDCSGGMLDLTGRLWKACHCHCLSLLHNVFLTLPSPFTSLINSSYHPLSLTHPDIPSFRH